MKAQNRHKINGIGRNLIKSEIYAFLAMHALEIELREFNTIREKISKNKLRRYVLEYAAKTNNHGTLTRAYEAATGEIVEKLQVRKVSISLTSTFSEKNLASIIMVSLFPAI